MVRVCYSIVLAASVICFGCGKSEQVAKEVPTSTDPSPTSEPSPKEIVSQFLDLVRRGGEDSGASDLLTEKAQAALAGIGRSVQPIGSPDARFNVTRSERVPGDEHARLVQSLWSEPNADGTESSYEVVWAVRREASGWRISGLVMRMGEDDEPMVVNFEDSALMVKVLADEPNSEVSGDASQAAAPKVSPASLPTPHQEPVSAGIGS